MIVLNRYKLLKSKRLIIDGGNRDSFKTKTMLRIEVNEDESNILINDVGVQEFVCVLGEVCTLDAWIVEGPGKLVILAELDDTDGSFFNRIKHLSSEAVIHHYAPDPKGALCGITVRPPSTCGRPDI